MKAVETKKAFYIGGRWREGVEYVDLFAPYNNEKLAEIPQASQEDVNDAIESASEAFKITSKMPAHERATLLYRLADKFEERKEDLAKILAYEAAKPYKAALGEILRTAATYRFAAEEAKRIYGETLPLDAAAGGENRFAYTVRKPIGVIGAITPFNFPFNLVAHKVGPAFAAGNTIVLKPASQTPLSSLALAELWDEVGFPKGSLNVITGKGSVVGDALVKDTRIAGLTFTGSPQVGIALKNKAGLKKVTLELGSNSAVIIDETVEITEELINRCAWGAFIYNGQVCISLQRIYIHETKYDEFLSRFVEVVSNLRVGDPLHEETDVTALISKSEVTRMDNWVNEAVSFGANIAYGGYKVNESIYAPTVLTNVKNHASVSCQEVFGPIVLITPFTEVQEAVAYVNDSQFGLQAGLFTKDLAVALQLADELEVGGVMINDVPTFRVDHMPYGGVKQSGFGREGVKYAIEEMTELKLVVIKR